MPIGTEMPPEEQLVKLLLVGDSKTGKTHYAGQAAVAGFKVLYLDGDVSRPTIGQLPKDALARIFYLNFSDMISEQGQYIPRNALLLKKFLTDGVFKWNDTKTRGLRPAMDVGDRVYDITASKLTGDWVVVIDSWTGVSHSVMSAIALDAGIDLSSVDKAGLGVYGSANNFATDLLSRIRSLPCHVIVIAHPDEFIKYKVKRGSVREAGKTENREIEFSRWVPKSISRPHAMTLPSYFTDVGWLEIDVMDRRIVDFGATAERSAGGRFTTRLAVQDAAFAELVRRAGGSVPEQVTFEGDPALILHDPYEPPANLAATTSVLNPTGKVGGTVAMPVGKTASVKAAASPLALLKRKPS